MTETLFVSTVIPAKPAALFEAWLDSQSHSQFTGSKAIIEPSVGGAFSAWDGYITGTTLELYPCEKIVQSWRTSEFPDGSPDSHLIITFEETKDGTLISLNHTGIPNGQAEDYKVGWEEYYFTPMKEYFAADADPAK
jgi:activator of HSP90 ATPase